MGDYEVNFEFEFPKKAQRKEEAIEENEIKIDFKEAKIFEGEKVN